MIKGCCVNCRKERELMINDFWEISNIRCPRCKSKMFEFYPNNKNKCVKLKSTDLKDGNSVKENKIC